MFICIIIIIIINIIIIIIINISVIINVIVNVTITIKSGSNRSDLKKIILDWPVDEIHGSAGTGHSVLVPPSVSTGTGSKKNLGTSCNLIMQEKLSKI